MSNFNEINEDGWTYTEWCTRADRHIELICGLGLDDLVDGPSRACWNDGVKPKDYALMMLEESGSF